MATSWSLSDVNGYYGHNFHAQMGRRSIRPLFALDPTGSGVNVGGALVRQKPGCHRRTFIDENNRRVAESSLVAAMRDAVERRCCPTCGHALVRRRSDTGEFYGCETYVVGGKMVPGTTCVTKAYFP